MIKYLLKKENRSELFRLLFALLFAIGMTTAVLISKDTLHPIWQALWITYGWLFFSFMFLNIWLLKKKNDG